LINLGAASRCAICEIGRTSSTHPAETQSHTFLEESIMTMFQRKRIKEEMERQHALAEAGADSLLGKLKASKWTAAILLGAIVLAAGFVWALS
jgi:hypothetical protein